MKRKWVWWLLAANAATLVLLAGTVYFSWPYLLARYQCREAAQADKSPQQTRYVYDPSGRLPTPTNKPYLLDVNAGKAAVLAKTATLFDSHERADVILHVYGRHTPTADVYVTRTYANGYSRVDCFRIIGLEVIVTQEPDYRVAKR